MHLVPFEADHAGHVSSWAPTATEVEAWCSLTKAPVSVDAIRAWSLDPSVHAFVLTGEDDTEIAAYGELWIDDAEEEVELAHLIVDPGRRGNGVGRTLVELLTARAKEWHSSVVLRVREENTWARRSYESAGFTRASSAEEAAWNEHQPHPYVWMRSTTDPSG